MPFQHTIHYFDSCIFRNNSISVIYSLKRIPHWIIASNVWETTSNFTRNSTFILVILRNTSKFYIWIVYTLERKQSPEWQMSQTSSKQQSKRYEPERKQREMLPKILKRLLTFYPHQNLKEILRRKAKKSYVHCTVIMNRISFKFLSDLWVFNSS